MTAMTTKRRARVEDAIARFSQGGASGRLISYAVGHSVCEVEISSPDGAVRLRAEFTRRIETWSRWDVIDLRLRVDSQGHAVLEDPAAGFRLVAGAVFVLGADGAPLAEDDDLPGEP